MKAFKYFPIDDKQRKWGIFLTDCGHATILPDQPYPPKTHPTGYYFTWKKGRRLSEYQLLYISHGAGIFESEDRRGIRELSAGDLVLLAPGVWHRYSPDKNTGWTEHWIGFSGDIATRVMQQPFFNTSGDVIRLPHPETFEKSLVKLIDEFLCNADLPYTAGARVLELLGFILEARYEAEPDTFHERAIRQAQFYIGRHAAEPIDFRDLAKHLGLGYTTFRRNFATMSGFAPLQYQLQFRLRRARNLLINTEMPITEIARVTGFKTLFYFSRFFQNQTGITARAYRLQNVSKNVTN